MHAQHGALCAFVDAGGHWQKTEYYAVSGDSRARSIDAEVHAVRSRVGSRLVDARQIEVYGPLGPSFWTAFCRTFPI